MGKHEGKLLTGKRSKSWEFLRQQEDCGQRTLDVPTRRGP